MAQGDRYRIRTVRGQLDTAHYTALSTLCADEDARHVGRELERLFERGDLIVDQQDGEPAYRLDT